MYNTQYPLLLNQHNGDDAPQDCGEDVSIHLHYVNQKTTKASCDDFH